MAFIEAMTVVLVFGALLAVVSTVPYSLTAIEYRQRDNGLAYLLLVLGVGVWNLMFAVQILSQDPLIKSFFLGLATVGAVQSGLGWFLFASTASSTSDILNRRDVYGVVGILGGLTIVLAVTAPVHTFYWHLPTSGQETTMFVSVVPAIGYWLHTALLGGLFVAGTGLFVDSWNQQRGDTYLRAYTVAGTATVIAVVGSNVLAPGGFEIASIVAIGLTTSGWLQAARGQPLAWLR